LRAELELHDAPAPPSKDEVGSDVAAAIRDLPPEHRAVIVLRYLLEYTPGEIASLLDLPRGTVNSRLRRGLDRLREQMP
jgi:RNA polymerase sigma-70 factor (ECF subfamily)